MTKEKSNATSNVLVLVLVLLLFVSAVGAIGVGAYYWKQDNDADGKNKIVDSNDAGRSSSAKVTPKVEAGTTAPGGTTTPSGTTPATPAVKEIIYSGGVDVDGDLKFTSPGEITPKGNVNVIITSLKMDTLYKPGERLYTKIFLLPPMQAFQATATIDVRGGDINLPVSVEFYLNQGNLESGAVKHTANDQVLLMDRKSFDKLTQGTKTVSLSGKAPNYQPRHDWYLGMVVIQVQGQEVVRKTFWQDNAPADNKWLTLSYPTVWTNIPSETGWDSVTLIDEGDFIKFKLDRKIFRGAYAGKVTVNQLTHPGKYLLVYDGEVDTSLLASLEKRDAFQTFAIPKNMFATVEPNEAYLKLMAWDTTALGTGGGNVIDLNTASDDTSARVEISFKVNGQKAWIGSQEYFSVLDKIFMPFSIFGRGHPEKDWF